jgi:hypothetical protein
VTTPFDWEFVRLYRPGVKLAKGEILHRDAKGRMAMYRNRRLGF